MPGITIEMRPGEAREFNWSDEIEQAITKVWDEFTFNEVQSVFPNWMSLFARAIENGESI
jgi:hypothetical protein